MVCKTPTRKTSGQISLADFPSPAKMLSDKPKQNPEPIFSDLFLDENDQSQEFTLNDSSLDISQQGPQTGEA